MKNIRIREAVISDLPAYVHICMEIWGGKDYEKISNRLKKSFSIFNSGYSIALIDNKVVGTGEAFPVIEKLNVTGMNGVEDVIDLYAPDGKYFYIHGIEVLSKYRKLGIGRALLDYNIDLANKLNCAQIYGIGIHENIDFWFNHGFKSEGTWQSYKNFGRFIRIYKQL